MGVLVGVGVSLPVTKLRTKITQSLWDSTTNVVHAPNVLTAMIYDKENRLKEHSQNAWVNTFLYDGDGLKRVEASGATRNTLVWDGSNYLQERS